MGTLAVAMRASSVLDQPWKFVTSCNIPSSVSGHSASSTASVALYPWQYPRASPPCTRLHRLHGRTAVDSGLDDVSRPDDERVRVGAHQDAGQAQREQRGYRDRHSLAMGKATMGRKRQDTAAVAWSSRLRSATDPPSSLLHLHVVETSDAAPHAILAGHAPSGELR